MTLMLKNFKRVIPATILTRGRDYFHSGRVSDLALEDDDTWVAEVQGTEPYEVRVKQQKDQSLACSCTCPYEFGDYCKHVAAALYAIEEAFPEYLDGARRKPAKRVSRMSRLEKALRAVSPDQLVELLLELAKENRDIQIQLLLRLDTAETSADYRRLVKDALRPPRGSQGYLDYWAATQAGQRLGEILDRAAQALPSRPESALSIYQTILEETIAALDHADDSNGVLYGTLEQALEGLAQCAGLLSPAGRDALFNYCLGKADNSQIRGSDFRWNLLSLTADLVETPDERSAFFAALDELEKAAKSHSGYYSSDYEAESSAALKLEVIRRLEGEEAALAFVFANKHLHKFRTALIQHHAFGGDLNAARLLAEEGLASASRKGNPLPGVALTYRNLILQIAQAQGDRETIIEQARILWLHRRGNEYYTLLTDVVPPAEWGAFRERLLKDRECGRDMAAWAYAQEGLWAEVRDIVLADPRLLPMYQLEMEARFPNEVTAAYRRFVEKMLAEVSNRETYREAAGYLVRMQKLGHGQEGKSLARSLIEQYPQRRAMIEELKRAL